MWWNSYNYSYDDVDIDDFVGKTFVTVEDNGDCVEFKTADGELFAMVHQQSCCESVELESISGELEWLVDTPIIKAEENSECGSSRKDFWPDDVESPYSKSESGYWWGPDSYTWTFYRITTNKGTVVLRWYGTSNGYYSERVSIVKKKEK